LKLLLAYLIYNFDIIVSRSLYYLILLLILLSLILNFIIITVSSNFPSILKQLNTFNSLYKDWECFKAYNIDFDGLLLEKHSFLKSVIKFGYKKYNYFENYFWISIFIIIKVRTS
jgi:hypothetical protein